MRILLDQGTPVPLRAHLTGRTVSNAFEKGWAGLANGELLQRAEVEFDVLISTDQSLRHQQDLGRYRLAVLILTPTSWPRIRSQVSRMLEALAGLRRGEYQEVEFVA